MRQSATAIDDCVLCTNSVPRGTDIVFQNRDVFPGLYPLARLLAPRYHSGMVRGVCGTICGTIVAGLMMAASWSSSAAACTRTDFEAVVDEAAGALRDLNASNKPKFQEKLRSLKDKRGWAHEQFLKEAAPFVADDKILAYDQQSNALLQKIATGGEAGAISATPDCNALNALRGSMKTLVDTQTAKWTYMNTKLDAELSK